jgi:protein-disulfide isomerase
VKGASRNRLLLLFGAVAAAAVIVVVVVVFVGNGGGSSSANDTTTTTTGGSGPSSPEAVSAFAGVRQKGLELGKATAPNTLYIFEDPQCPYCRQWSIDSEPSAIDEFVRTGQVKFELRPIEVIGPDSEPGIRAVYAASQQNKAYNMLEALYERQGEEQSGWITPSVIAASAREVGADPVALKKAMPTAKVTAQWAASEKLVQLWGVGGTPTFALVKPLGTPQQVNPSSLEPTDFNAALRAALQ